MLFLVVFNVGRRKKMEISAKDMNVIFRIVNVRKIRLFLEKSM